jgi:hypothetical protein
VANARISVQRRKVMSRLPKPCSSTYATPRSRWHQQHANRYASARLLSVARTLPGPTLKRLRIGLIIQTRMWLHPRRATFMSEHRKTARLPVRVVRRWRAQPRLTM